MQCHRVNVKISPKLERQLPLCPPPPTPGSCVLGWQWRRKTGTEMARERERERERERRERERERERERGGAYRYGILVDTYGYRFAAVGMPTLTRALLGLWIFHHLRGGGCLNTPRLSRLLRIVEQNRKQRSKAREKSFRNHFGHFWLRSKLRSPGVKKIKSLILKVEQRF